jgi:hypothetical protein
LLNTLPAEIREMILRLLLGTDEELYTEHWNALLTEERRHLRPYYGPVKRPETDIMATCQQMHSEGAHILYSQNAFVYHNTRISVGPGRTLTEMHPRYAGLVRRAVATIPYIEFDGQVDAALGNARSCAYL